MTEASEGAMLQDVRWLGHDTFQFRGARTVYTDPYQIDAGPPADLVLITHEHSDHFSPEDLARIRAPHTQVLTTPDVARQLPGAIAMRPGERQVVAGIEVEAVPAYNVDKFRKPGKPFHPREDGKLGFVFTLGGRRFYHAGDTDLIPGMDAIRCDVALLPVGGTYTMTADEAAEAARRLRPAVAVPMHWGSIVGSEQDARRFRDLLAGQVEVVILPRHAASG
jgi:L-ascorbate metabolism protein UlaG (beta-lactamase superfamily)